MEVKLQYLGETRPYDGDIYNLSTQGTLKIRKLNKKELDEFEDGLIKDAFKKAQKEIAGSVAQDMILYAKQTYQKELDRLVKEYINKNKDKIFNELLKEAEQEAVSRLRSAALYYD